MRLLLDFDLLYSEIKFELKTLRNFLAMKLTSWTWTWTIKETCRIMSWCRCRTLPRLFVAIGSCKCVVFSDAWNDESIISRRSFCCSAWHFFFIISWRLTCGSHRLKDKRVVLGYVWKHLILLNVQFYQISCRTFKFSKNIRQKVYEYSFGRLFSWFRVLIWLFNRFVIFAWF